MYDVLSYSVDVDFSLVYSERFACLNAMQPHSVLLAEGSEVMVRSGLRIDAAQMPSAAD
jgi:hypothetical protein